MLKRCLHQDYRGLTDFERINGVDGVYVANVADQAAEPEMSLLGGLQAVIFSNHLVRSGSGLFGLACVVRPDAFPLQS